MRRKSFHPEPGLRPGPAPGIALGLALLLLAACRGKESQPSAPAQASGSPQAAAVATLLTDQAAHCHDFAESILASLKSWEEGGKEEAARRALFRENVRGAWRGWAASVAVDEEEIEPQLAYLEGIRDPEAASLRTAFQAVRSYCRAVADGRTVQPFEYRVGRDSLWEEAQRRAYTAAERSPSTAASQDLVARARARSNAARKAGEAAWAVERARAEEARLRDQEALTSETPESTPVDTWAERRTRDPRGAPLDTSGARERRVAFDWSWYRDQGRVRLEAGIRNVGSGAIEGGRAKITITNSSGLGLVRREIRFEDALLAPGAETHFAVSLSSPSVSSFYRCEIVLSDSQGRPLTTQKPIETKKTLRERGLD